MEKDLNASDIQLSVLLVLMMDLEKNVLHQQHHALQDFSTMEIQLLAFQMQVNALQVLSTMDLEKNVFM